VVDAAVPPDRRSSPHRLLIIIAVTISSFFVAAFWILLRERWTRVSDIPENRQRLEALKDRWKEKHDVV
jgi:uncharacterized protein involved in exopolysaccharide biosynthesis